MEARNGNEMWFHRNLLECENQFIVGGVEPNAIFHSEDGNYWYLKLILQEMESNTRE